ncbi:MAG: DUF5872 domain-containing protein [Pseudomonadota bacterium]|nr:DUF5872 domain-containing protein [Pseudomonadota bacterium]
MAATAKKTDPALWDRVKREITDGGRGGKPGQWSARKAQLAVQDYKKQGGGYAGRKDPDNHLKQWTEEDWGTKSGAKSGETGERYLPRRARARLTEKEYAETTAKKRDDTEKSRQFSAQPPRVARKTAHDRALAHPLKAGGADQDRMSLKRAELVKKAAQAGIAGRSRMSKAQLIEGLR